VYITAFCGNECGCVLGMGSLWPLLFTRRILVPNKYADRNIHEEYTKTGNNFNAVPDCSLIWESLTIYMILQQLQHIDIELGRTNIFCLQKFDLYWKILLPPSQYIRRNHLWFKDQGIYLILFINTSITASIYVRIERESALYYGTWVKSGYALYIRTGGVLSQHITV
jgi:hypothetical protein